MCVCVGAGGRRGGGDGGAGRGGEGDEMRNGRNLMVNNWV